MSFFFVLQASGSQQVTDDLDLYYGGVIYTYNSYEVRVWLPDINDGRGLGVPISTG